MSVYKVNVSDLIRDFVKYSKYVLLCNDHMTIQKYYTMTVITTTTASREDAEGCKGEERRQRARAAQQSMYCTPA